MIPLARLGRDHASPGNRFLIPPKQVSGLRRLLVEEAWAVVAPIATSHAITEAAHAALTSDDARGFVCERREELDRREEMLLQSSLSWLE